MKRLLFILFLSFAIFGSSNKASAVYFVAGQGELVWNGGNSYTLICWSAITTCCEVWPEFRSLIFKGDIYKYLETENPDEGDIEAIFYGVTMEEF